MDDLLQKQIRDSCKLALPDGLQDLMSDISREVLRARPQNLLQFITDYLAALLVARENLFIASQVCDNVCKTRCYPELENELRKVGLSDEDIQKTVKVVSDFFESGGVKETNLLIKLLKKTEIDETQLPAVLEAVRGAFLRHQVNNTVVYESSSTESDLDESLIAAKHTLKIYKKTKEPGDNYNNVVEKIQAAYRAYNVRRKFHRQNRERAASPSKKKTNAAEKALSFDPKKVELLFPETPRSKRCSSKASSVSLAGSFVPLPPYKPYSIDDIVSEVDEVSEKEKEHSSFDYTQHWNNALAWNEPGDKQKDVSMKKKIISFHDLPQIINTNSEESDDEIPEEVEEADDEFEVVDEELLQEQLIKDHVMWSHYYTKPKENKNEAQIKYLSNTTQKVLRNEQVTRIPTITEDCTKIMGENTEALNEYDNNIIHKNLTKKQEIPPPIINVIIEHVNEQLENNAEVQGDDDDDDDGTIDEEMKHEIFTDEPIINNLATEPIEENARLKSRYDDDFVDEQLTYEPATGQIVEEQTMQINSGTELIAENDETENKDDDKINIEEFVNEPVIMDVVEEEMMWYGDGYEQAKQNFECESRDSDNIIEYFDNESAAASFIDLS